MKNNYKKLFFLGFGFFAVSLTWSIYNSFMPLLLSKYISNAAIIGFIMTIDNYLALFIQPAIGTFSDKVNTPFGRRMPFLMIGMPIAAAFLFLIPNYWNLKSLIFFLVLMNLSMSIFRSPVISLMPDITPLEERSKANSIINLMGGIGALIAYFIGSILSSKNEAYPFYMSGILVLISFIVLFTTIKEKRDSLNYHEAEEKEEIKEKVNEMVDKKSLIFLLIAICTYFIAYQGIEAFFSLYGVQFLNYSKKVTVMSFAFMSLSFLLFAIPSGYLGTKFGKKKTMMGGIFGLFICFTILGLLRNIAYIRILFIISGMFWAMININAYPFVVEMAPKSKTGAYTGYYYLVSSIAAIVSPPLLGFINNISYKYMFFYGSIFFLISLISISKVKTIN